MNDMPKVFEVPAYWKTPASAYPVKELGTARIKRVHYRKGSMYHMNWVRGFEYLRTDGKIPVTNLQIKEGKQWKTWMTDDPSHWMEMCDMIHRVKPSRLLCAGLGLGLMIQAIAELQREEIQEIVVIERNKDVIELIAPMLPLQDRTTILCTDFMEFVKKRQPFDTVLIDIWVGEPKKFLSRFLSDREWIELFYPYPETLTLYFGFQKMIDGRRELYDMAAPAMKKLNRRMEAGGIDF